MIVVAYGQNIMIDSNNYTLQIQKGQEEGQYHAEMVIFDKISAFLNEISSNVKGNWTLKNIVFVGVNSNGIVGSENLCGQCIGQYGSFLEKNNITSNVEIPALYFPKKLK